MSPLPTIAFLDRRTLTEARSAIGVQLVILAEQIATCAAYVTRADLAGNNRHALDQADYCGDLVRRALYLAAADELFDGMNTAAQLGHPATTIQLS